MKHRKQDFYSKKAKKEHYPARSVFKLETLDKKYSLIKPGFHILDLGSSPGSWMKYAAEKTGNRGNVIGIDVKPLSIPIPENGEFILADIFDDSITQPFSDQATLFDLIMSDMAPSTSGIKSVDHQRSLNLAFRALDIAQLLLKKNGSFLCKFFQGKDNQLLFDTMKTVFKTTRIEKPPSSRKESFELFVVGLGKK